MSVVSSITAHTAMTITVDGFSEYVYDLDLLAHLLYLQGN